MELREFHNALRILLNIEPYEIVEAGIDAKHWPAFSADPHRFFIRCDDETADRLWAIVERRAKPRQVAGHDALAAMLDALGKARAFVADELERRGDDNSSYPLSALEVLDAIDAARGQS